MSKTITREAADARLTMTLDGWKHAYAVAREENAHLERLVTLARTICQNLTQPNSGVFIVPLRAQAEQWLTEYRAIRIGEGEK